MNTRNAITCAIVLAIASLASAAEEWVAGQLNGDIRRLVDANGDGDAFDNNENTLWFSGLSRVTSLASAPRGVFALDGIAGSVTLLKDANGDGDARDTAEAMLWAQGFSNSWGITRSGAGLYVSEQGSGNIWRMEDTNGDGDALDVGEKLIFANVPGATGLLDQCGQLFVTSQLESRVYRLRDENGDGDALDIGESLIHTPDTLSNSYGLIGGGHNTYFATTVNSDTVHIVNDRNGDGDALDVGEVLTYADSVFGGLDEPLFMAPVNAGGFLLTEFTDGEISLVRDANGDGDSLDIGDVTLFANMSQPTGIAQMPRLAGDVNWDRIVDIEDYSLFLEQFGRGGCDLDSDLNEDGFTDLRDFVILRANFGLAADSPVTSAPTMTTPEPATLILLLSSAAAVLTRRKQRPAKLSGLQPHV